MRRFFSLATKPLVVDVQNRLERLAFPDVDELDSAFPELSTVAVAIPEHRSSWLLGDENKPSLERLNGAWIQ